MSGAACPLAAGLWAGQSKGSARGPPRRGSAAPGRLSCWRRTAGAQRPLAPGLGALPLRAGGSDPRAAGAGPGAGPGAPRAADPDGARAAGCGLRAGRAAGGQRPRPRRAHRHGGPAESAGCAGARGHEEEGRRRPGQSGLGAAPQPQPQPLGARGGGGRRRRRGGARARPRGAGARRGDNPRGPGEWPRLGPFLRSFPFPGARAPETPWPSCRPARDALSAPPPAVGTAWPAPGARGGSAARAWPAGAGGWKIVIAWEAREPRETQAAASPFGVVASGAARLRLGRITDLAGLEGSWDPERELQAPPAFDPALVAPAGLPPPGPSREGGVLGLPDSESEGSLPWETFSGLGEAPLVLSPNPCLAHDGWEAFRWVETLKNESFYFKIVI